MKEDFQEYEEIIKRMTNSPKFDPPIDFKDKVMERLLMVRQGLGLFRLKQILFNHIVMNFNPRRVSSQPESNKRESSFYFFLTGFFYIIMGVIMTDSFRTIGLCVSERVGFGLQTFLIFGTGFWLLTLGLILLLEGKVVVAAVRYGTFFYVFSVMINGILLRPYFHVPHADVFIIGFVAGGICIGILLLASVRKVRLSLTWRDKLNQ